MAQVQYDMTTLVGGLDQMSSGYQLAPGALRDCINFACKPTGGYYRVPGYERFDGQTQPHTASFLTIDVTLDPGKSLAIGDEGDFGNITGTVCYLDPFGEYVGLTKTTPPISYSLDPFVPGDIDIGGDIKGQATGYHTQLTLLQLALIKAYAANIYRGDIGAVPGSGPIRGVVFYKDVAYAFRDNAGGTEEDIYKSTAAGWVQVPLGQIVPFGAGTDDPVTSGGTLTQGGVTATIRRWVVTSGDLYAGPPTAVGYFVIDTLAGGNFAAGAATQSTGAGAVNLTGAESQITLAPGGSYEFDLGNFAASSANQRIYGADSVNDGFEFDGVTYVPLQLGLAIAPSYVKVHANHLFFGVGSSLIHSAIGNPYNYETINGAGEIGTGGDITGLLLMVGNQTTSALATFARNSMWILYGTSASDWNFVSLNVGVGAWGHSAQNLFDGFAMDDRGVTMLRQTLNYGNFDSATLTHNIQRFIDQQRGKVAASGVSRKESQYRAFFNDGYGLYSTVTPQGLVGHGLVLFPDPVTCCFDSEDSGGETYELFGTADGFVMRNDVGTSFDGARIGAYLNTNINTAKTPRLRKRWRKLILEVQGTSFVEMSVGFTFEWSSPFVLTSPFRESQTDLIDISQWDNFIWDSFYWDGRSNDVSPIGLDGTGENLQTMFITNSDYVGEFTVSSALFHYSPRRGNR